MKQVISRLFLLTLLLLCVVLKAGDGASFETKWLKLAFDGQGRLTELLSTADRMNYLAGGKPSFFAHIYMRGDTKRIPVVALSSAAAGRDCMEVLTLKFANGVEAVVEAKKAPLYLAFTLKSISGGDVDYFEWGPYRTTISKVVGSCVGVVHNDKFAVSLRTAEINTDSIAADARAFKGRQGNNGGSSILVRRLKGLDGAGSILEASSKDRTREEIVDVGINKGVVAYPVKGVTVVGSKILVFGSPPGKVMDAMEAAVKGEGLPCPRYQGVWVKRLGIQAAPRLIVPFSDKNVDEYIAIAKAGDFKTLHVKIPYESKGTFEPAKSLYPNGWESVRACAEKIKTAGLIPAFHNLSGFIDLNDPLVTPVPNKNLAECGIAKLAKGISAADTSIVLGEGANFASYMLGNESKIKASGSKKGKRPARKIKFPPLVLRVDDELIQYKSAKLKGGEVVLIGCRRGYAGTKVVAHECGTRTSRVTAHKRKNFYPNIRLLPQVALNLSKTFVKGGILGTSFDGLASTLESGHGPYAQALFTQIIWDAIKKNGGETFFSSSSRLNAYYWYLCSQESWGEPHEKGFRHTPSYYKVKIKERIENILKPNYIAYRLGQYQFNKLSSITDVEWLMTKCAGLGGGFDLYLTLDDYKRSGDFGKKVMATISLWWKAMHTKGVFTPEVRKDMVKFGTVYHLSRNGKGEFILHKLSSEEAKEVVKPVLGKRGKSKHDVELYH